MNARQEFISHTKGKKVKCASSSFIDYATWKPNPKTVALLKTGYSKAELKYFLSKTDVTYSSGYGTQELYGFIWYEDGTWSERYEYDGSESWDYKSSPKIPATLC